MNGVLLVTDPLTGLQADIDASIGLMSATQDLGFDLWCCEPEELAVVDGQVRGRRQVIAQQYLPAVAHGNKRLFLLDGEILGTVLRRPAVDDFRIGPPAAPAEIDEADRAIVNALRPHLVRNGLAVASLVVRTVHAVGMLTAKTLASHGPLRDIGAMGTYAVGVTLGITAIATI